MTHRTRQTPAQIVRVGTWERDEDFPIFPVGSKPKRLLICPGEEKLPFLIPGHRYLFKVAQGWQTFQIWSEIIAYEIARSLSVEVPPSFLAVDEVAGEIGVLVEFFYGYPTDPAPPRLVHGIDLLQRYFPRVRFDRKVGRPHALVNNLKICRRLQIKEAESWWGTTLGFDALIGNTDRHPENWGILVARSPVETPMPSRISLKMAPPFDNGTSLGYEQPNARLAQPWPDERLFKYMRRGTHHLGWSAEPDRGLAHPELCKLLASASDSAGAAIRTVIRLSDSEIESVTAWCEEFDAAVPFTRERAEFVRRLLEARRDVIAAAIG